MSTGRHVLCTILISLFCFKVSHIAPFVLVLHVYKLLNVLLDFHNRSRISIYFQFM